MINAVTIAVIARRRAFAVRADICV